MLDSKELETFQKHFHELQQKALDYLLHKLWKDDIDRNVKVITPIVDRYGMSFELISTMMDKLIYTKTMTWEEINELRN